MTKTQTLTARGISIDMPVTWSNITESDDEPLTVTDPENGVGGLQLTIALHEEGPDAQPTVNDLKEMLVEFAKTQNLLFLDQPTTVPSLQKEVLIVSASFRFMKTEYLRAFYVADQRHFVFATYTCAWEDRELEAETCEAIIKSLAFLEE